MALGRRSTHINPETLEQGRTFFCSELVAKAYKYSGIMPTDTASGHFKPSNFSSTNDQMIKLVKGATLTKEILIVL